ncbi:hypothetical protein BGZ82_004681, partial [Podila clonocystis]
MNLASLILRTHFGDPETNGSLSYNIRLLGRKHIGLDKADFHATDELLRHTFDALVLSVWKDEFGCSDSDINMSEGSKESEDVDENSDKDQQHDMEKNAPEVDESVNNIFERILQADNLPCLDVPSSRNAALFIRDMLFYLELGSAIKAGDVGRILEVIKYLTILFQAGNTKLYGSELLHL